MYLVPQSVLHKSASWCFDICIPSDATSACFTKSYTRYIKGTGSVLYLSDQSMSCNIHASPLVNEENRYNVNETIDSSNGGDSNNNTDNNDMTKNIFRCTPHQRAFQSNWQSSSSSSCSSLLLISKDKDKDNIGNDNQNQEYQLQSSRFQYNITYGTLRFFTPSELLSLFGFPSTYSLPPSLATCTSKSMSTSAMSLPGADDTPSTGVTSNSANTTDSNSDEQQKSLMKTNKKYYELIGNSLNVTVGVEVLQVLLLSPPA